MSTYSSYADEQLLAYLAKGDQQAFKHLLDRYQRKVFNQAFYWLKDLQRAEEVTQDIFLKLWFKRETIPAVSSFDNYLFILARNTIFNALENMPVKEISLEISVDPEISDAHHHADAAILMKDAENQATLLINQLPPARRKVFIMSRFREMTYEQIARELNISRSGVRDHMVKALQFLRNAIGSNLFLITLLRCLLHVI